MTSDSTSGYPTLCPYLVVPDAAGVIDFLRRAFDAEQQTLERAGDGRIVHAELRFGDSVVMIGSAAPGHQASLHLTVGDLDAAYGRALAAGGESVREPADQSYGSRSAGVRDPGGNTWWLAGPLRAEASGDQPLPGGEQPGDHGQRRQQRAAEGEPGPA